MMRKLASVWIVGIGLSLALTAPAFAAPADGPFATEAALDTFWNNQPETDAFLIYVNGHFSVFKEGFGPATFKQYFTCSDGIRTTCANIGGGSSTTSHLITFDTNHAPVFLDGTLLQGGPGIGSWHLATCTGQAALGFPAPTYFVVLTADDGFSPPLFGGGHCF